jgi:hypothetical protein
MKLTKAQIKILEDAFSRFPADYTSSTNFTSMEGIQRQLDALENENGYIFYMSEYDRETMSFKIEKMVPGLDVQQNIMADYTPEEPTESQIRNRMTTTGENYYNARENLREEAYGEKYSKSPGQSWGDYWKSY